MVKNYNIQVSIVKRLGDWHNWLTLKLGCKNDTMSQWYYYKKGLHVFFLNSFFSYEWILEDFFGQLVIINAYNCTSTWKKKIIFF